MANRLTEKQMLQLVEIYRDNECLWNVTSDLYKDRGARKTAYRNILQNLNIPGLSLTDIPNKIKNLRTSYYQELKRIEKSTRSGASQDSVYKPRVSWFTTADGFLKSLVIKKEPFSNIDQNSNSISDNESEAQNIKLEEYSDSEVSSNTADGYIFIEDNSKIAIKSTSPNRGNQKGSSSSSFTRLSKNPVRKRKIEKNDEVHKAIAKIDKIANKINKSVTSLIETQDDEFDTFGKYIAMTLRALPTELAIDGKTDIQKAISEIQLRALRQNSQPTLLSYDHGIIIKQEDEETPY